MTTDTNSSPPDVAALRRLNDARRDPAAHWNAREIARNALQSLLMRETDAILAALEEREGLMPALQGLLRLIDLMEASARLRDGSGYGIANVTAVVNVLRQADAVRAALAIREAEEAGDAKFVMESGESVVDYVRRVRKKTI